MLSSAPPSGVRTTAINQNTPENKRKNSLFQPQKRQTLLDKTASTAYHIYMGHVAAFIQPTAKSDSVKKNGDKNL
jgi:hypothetical protein